MQIPGEVKEMFDGKRIIPLATVDESGMPNVVPMFQYIWHNEDELVIADLYMKATKDNIIANGKASVSAWEGAESYKLRGTARYETEGPTLDAFLEAKPGIKEMTKGVVIIKVTEVYDASKSEKGANAGKLIVKE